LAVVAPFAAAVAIVVVLGRWATKRWAGGWQRIIALVLVVAVGVLLALVAAVVSSYLMLIQG
jgi:hypothetical protein